MNKRFIEPTIEIISFPEDDIIVTSVGGGNQHDQEDPGKDDIDG